MGCHVGLAPDQGANYQVAPASELGHRLSSRNTCFEDLVERRMTFRQCNSH